MADLSFEPMATGVVIRPLTDAGRKWVGKYIDRPLRDDGSVRVAVSDTSEIERAVRADGLMVGELAI